MGVLALAVLGIVAIVWIVRARARAKVEAQLNELSNALKNICAEVEDITPEERKEFFGEEGDLRSRERMSPPKDDARFAPPSDRSV
jgi:hypothetical protein